MFFIRAPPFFDFGGDGMNREDFIFTTGYDGDRAVVDSNAKKQYGKLSTGELLEAGLFKPALCSAIYSKDEKEIEAVLERYNSMTEKKVESVDRLKLVLGVHRFPDEIKNTEQI